MPYCSDALRYEACRDAGASGLVDGLTILRRAVRGRCRKDACRGRERAEERSHRVRLLHPNPTLGAPECAELGLGQIRKRMRAVLDQSYAIQLRTAEEIDTLFTTLRNCDDPDNHPPPAAPPRQQPSTGRMTCRIIRLPQVPRQ